MRTAIFPGSFDPFTIGHYDIVQRALPLFDEIVIGVGINAQKRPLFSPEERVEAIKKAGGVLCITADHGNCEQMLDKETGAPFTQHTTNPVPFILVNAHRLHKLRKGKLCDIAPTLLQLAGLSAPQEMTGESLILGE